MFRRQDRETAMNRLIVAAASLAASAPALAGMFIQPNVVPTLDDVGLMAITLVVAVAGGIAVRRRKK
jgi:hypothetical protein